MLLNEQHKYIFIHVPKVAGVSIQYALSRAKGHPSNARTRTFYDHVTCRQLIHKIGEERFGSFFSFAFVRNPWDWMHSLYYFTLQHHLKRWENLVPYYKQLGFNNWVINEYEKWTMTMTPWHTKTEPYQQLDWLIDKEGKNAVSFIGRYETLATDFNYVCKQIKDNVALPHANRTNHSHYHEEYNQEAIDKVAKSFARDIEYFNYEF